MPEPGPSVTVDTAAAAAAVGVTTATIRQWARRYPDDLPRRGSDDRGRTLYELGDVYKLAARLRARRRA